MKELAGNHLDAAIEATVSKAPRSKLSLAEVQALAAKLYTTLMMRGSIQALSALSEYYSDAKRMTTEELFSEQHKPARLARHMKAKGVARIPNTAVHAIVSGHHPSADAARRILARFRIRIDDPDNGVFLPKDSRYMPHIKMPNAVDHAKLHTKIYYLNVTRILLQTKNELECRIALRLIAKKLQDGTLRYKK